MCFIPDLQHTGFLVTNNVSVFGLYMEMHKMNIYGDNWLMLKEWYQNLTTKVKWEGQISRGFEINVVFLRSFQ
jgi:hypothetical protein